MAPRTARRCPYCDVAIDSSATFCDQCGKTLPATGSTHLLTTLPSPTRRSSPLLWVITITVFGVVLGLVGVLWSQASRPPSTVVIIATPSNPSGVSASAVPIVSACLVPNVVGQDQGAAEGLITGAGLQSVKSTKYDANIATGQVIFQDPPSGTEHSPCQGKVTIVVSLGPVPQPTVSLPTNTPVPPTTSPESTLGFISFVSPDNSSILNPILGWQPGGSTANGYDLNGSPGFPGVKHLYVGVFGFLMR